MNLEVYIFLLCKIMKYNNEMLSFCKYSCKMFFHINLNLNYYLIDNQIFLQKLK